MTFKLRKASDWKFDSSITIRTLKELLELIKNEGDVIVSEDTIIIYDDYLE